MSIIGVDFGNLSLLIGQAGKGGVDVILNDASNRQTATCVSIQGKQRFIGDAAAAMARSNITNTITGMKMLVGRKFDAPAVQKELKNYPFKADKTSTGGVGIYVSYKDENILLPVEHVMAMMIVKAKEIAAKANNNINVADSVLAVPFTFTDAQRRGILRACDIAQLNVLKITNESSAIALSYGIFKSAKKLFSETEPTHIMFIDIGYTGFCVTIVDFIQENMKVRATVTNDGVSGRALDDLIIEYLAEMFQKKTGINVRGNWKALLKLQVAAEKAKKTLSPNGVSEANVSVECLAEEKDLSVVLTRDEFEARAQSIVDKLEAPILQCLQLAKLDFKDIADVEIVGGTTRVNIVKRRLGEILKLDPAAMSYGLKTTMNSDEAVARGTALQCAMLSSRMKVKPFAIVDQLCYGVVAHFDTVTAPTPAEINSPGSDDSEAKEDMQVKGTSAAIYTAGDEIPHKPRQLTFKRKTSDFVITLTYDEAATAVLPEGEDKVIGKYTIKIPNPPAAGAPVPDVRVTFNIDKHSCVYIQSAQQLEEYTVTESVAPAKDGEPMAEEGKTPETVTKKKFKKIDLEIVSDVFGITKEGLKECLELEAAMANEDRVIIETADKRNELESYIYSMRDKLDLSLKEFSTVADRDNLKKLMDVSEDWLYNDGFDSTKAEYIKKLDELKGLGNPIENRFADFEARPAAIEALRKQLDLCKTFVANYDDSHSHITEEEREKIRAVIHATTSWMFDAQSHQADLPHHAEPVLSVAIITKKRNELFAVSNPIMTKPKPAPAATPAANDTKTKSEESSSKDGTPMEQEEDAPESSTPKEEEKMEV